MSDLKAEDKVGIIFCIIIAAIQEEGRDILLNSANIDHTLYRDIIYVKEMMLSFRAWLKRKKYWKYDNEDTLYNVQEAIEKFIEQIKDLIP